MTKVSVWGCEIEKTKKKPIELIDVLSGNDWDKKTTLKPKDFENIKLMRKGYGGYDIIFAWDGNYETPLIFRGNWNDGVVGV